MKTAHDYFHSYLLENVSDADTLERMKNVITEFSSRAPKIMVLKCIDGRVHGSKAKGYPPTTILFGRTDGNLVSFDRSNFWFWNRIDRVVKDAHFNTPETPALFIAFMHHSSRGLGCATHDSDDRKALGVIETMISEVRKVYSENELYIMGGDTDTDTMSETLIFPGDHRIDTSAVIKYCNLKEPRDVFHEAFLVKKIDDIATCRNIGHTTPEKLLDGVNPAFFDNFQICLNMETYLMREITTGIRRDRGELRRFIRPDILDYIFVTLDKVKIPANLLGPILYQVIWNITYALYQTRLISHLEGIDLDRHLDHAEELVCYGDGFETLPRNKAILVKTGRGDDIEALIVAKKVILKNRERYVQDHRPLVHINIEVNGQMTSWDSFNDNVGSRILTMLRNVDFVFEDNVAILTSYSYKQEKRFYPVIITRLDPRMVYPADVIAEINSTLKFSEISLKAEEALYKTKIMGQSQGNPQDH